MNMFGFVQFNRTVVADALARKADVQVELGRMNWHADSWHIYGKDIQSARQMLLDRVDSMAFEERVYNFHDEFIQDMYKSAEAAILAQIENYDQSRKGQDKP
jgi:thymidylate synthase